MSAPQHNDTQNISNDLSGQNIQKRLNQQLQVVKSVATSAYNTKKETAVKSIKRRTGKFIDGATKAGGKVLSAAATALGQPEIGMAIGASSGIASEYLKKKANRAITKIADDVTGKKAKKLAYKIGGKIEKFGNRVRNRVRKGVNSVNKFARLL